MICDMAALTALKIRTVQYSVHRFHARKYFEWSFLTLALSSTFRNDKRNVTSRVS